MLLFRPFSIISNGRSIWLIGVSTAQSRIESYFWGALFLLVVFSSITANYWQDGKETLEVKVEDKVDDSKLLVQFKSAKAKDVGYPNVGTKEVIGIFLR